jgi:hypothetical protein
MPVNYGKLREDMIDVIPGRLTLGHYLLKNEKAEPGYRFCNTGWCFVYKPVKEFPREGQTYSQFCRECEKKALIANNQITEGVYTAAQICHDPTIIGLPPCQKLCPKCEKIIPTDSLRESRKICRSCDNSRKTKMKEEFSKIIHQEIYFLENMNTADLCTKLKKYFDPQLYSIMKHFNIPRADAFTRNEKETRILKYFLTKKQKQTEELENKIEHSTEIIFSDESIPIQTETETKPEHLGIEKEVYMSLKLEAKLKALLPEYMKHSEFLVKNKEATQGEQYCRGWCLNFRKIEEFMKLSDSYSTICTNCRYLVKLADEHISKGTYTVLYLQKNPSILTLKEDERLCIECKLSKKFQEFERTRNICIPCCHKKRTERDEQKVKSMESQIETLSSKTKEELNTELATFSRNVVNLIAKHFSITRLASDSKEDMIQKIINHFHK